MLPILVIAVILIPGNLTHFYCCDWVDRWKLFLKILECLSVSESLRCYAGKGGGKFQDCHPDFGYKTCFSKFENGKAMTNILMNSKKYFLEKTFWFLFHCWQANVWLEAARPRGRCCTWNARRIRGEGFRAALYHVLCCVKNVKITTTTGNVTTRSKHVLEEFCYCSYDLCNSAGPSHAPAPRGWSLAALVLALHWALAACTRIMSSLL